jgi:hypothetical protein
MVKTSKVLDMPQGLAGEFLFNEPLSRRNCWPFRTAISPWQNCWSG